MCFKLLPHFLKHLNVINCHIQSLCYMYIVVQDAVCSDSKIISNIWLIQCIYRNSIVLLIQVAIYLLFSIILDYITELKVHTFSLVCESEEYILFKSTIFCVSVNVPCEKGGVRKYWSTLRTVLFQSVLPNLINLDHNLLYRVLNNLKC